MRVICDARNYSMYPFFGGGFHAATEGLIKRMARCLALAGHDVHVIYPGDERYEDGVNWWPADRGPRTCDVLIAGDRADRLGDFTFKEAHVLLTSVEPLLGDNASKVNTFVVLSNAHADVLRKHRPAVTKAQCLLLPPGVTMPTEAIAKVPHRLIWCNSPDRGLVHLARMWPGILAAVPAATIRVTYRVQEYIDAIRWNHSQQAYEALEIERWIRDNPTSVFAGVASYEDVIREQQRAELYAYPMDPLVAGTAVHALAAEEAAAAGCALLLTAHEGLPEVFGPAGADFLALPVNEDDWVREIVDVLKDYNRRRLMQTKARDWARLQPWSRWEQGWCDIVAGVRVASPEPETATV